MASQDLGALPVGFERFHRRDFLNYQFNRAHALGFVDRGELFAAAARVRSGPDCVPVFEDLSARALRDLERLRVEVRLNSVVTRIEPDAVCVGDERIRTRNVFWAAGNTASPLVRQLGVETDRAGRVIVEPDCSTRATAWSSTTASSSS